MHGLLGLRDGQRVRTEGAVSRCPLCVHCVCTVAPRKPTRCKRERSSYTLSINGKLHARLKAWCEANGKSVRQVVEEVCGDV